MKIACSKSRRRALTLVELCVVLAVLTFFAIFFAMQPDRNHKARALRIQCVNNLKQISVAFDVWAGDHDGKFPMELSETNGGTMEFTAGPSEWRHFQVMSNELSTPKVLYCPSEKFRTAATNFNTLANSNLSFFVALDFSKTTPQAIWSGDRNVTNGTPINDGILELTAHQPSGWTGEMHRKLGNLLLFDGSVQQVGGTGLRQAVANTGVFTNRFQMPILTR